VNKSELLRVLKGKCPELQASAVELALACLLEHLVSALASGERIEIRGFGSFDLHQRPPRIGRNPKAGVTVYWVRLNKRQNCFIGFFVMPRLAWL
jgi:integration host factor subunit beta